MSVRDPNAVSIVETAIAMIQNALNVRKCWIVPFVLEVHAEIVGIRAVAVMSIYALYVGLIRTGKAHSISHLDRFAVAAVLDLSLRSHNP